MISTERGLQPLEKIPLSMRINDERKRNRIRPRQFPSVPGG
jgi:hypothetical protein